MDKQASTSSRSTKTGETDNRNRFSESFDEYVKALQQLSQDQVQRLSTVHNDFVKSFQEAVSQQKTAALLEPLYFNFAKQWLDLSSPDNRQKDQQRVRDAYTAYLRNVQSAWSQLNLDTLDPPTLAAISQHLWAAAWLAANTAQSS